MVSKKTDKEKQDEIINILRPEIKLEVTEATKSVRKVFNIVSGIGFTSVVAAIFFLAVYKGKVDDLGDSAIELDRKITHEYNLRRIYWQDLFNFMNDANDPHYDSLLQYKAETPGQDTLYYIKK